MIKIRNNYTDTIYMLDIESYDKNTIKEMLKAMSANSTWEDVEDILNRMDISINELENEDDIIAFD